MEELLLYRLWPYAEAAGPFAALLLLALFLAERKERLASQGRERAMLERILAAIEVLQELRAVFNPHRKE